MVGSALTLLVRARKGVRVHEADFPDDATLHQLDRELYGFFRRRLPGDRDPQDFVADVMITLRSYRGESSLRTFAFTVARNMIADIRRRPRRTVPLPTTNDPAAPQAGPSTVLRWRQAADMLRSEVEAISPDYRDVMRLRLDGLGPSEIAERLGVKCHTVRSRFAPGLAQLRERLAGRRDSIEI